MILKRYQKSHLADSESPHLVLPESTEKLLVTLCAKCSEYMPCLLRCKLQRKLPSATGPLVSMLETPFHSTHVLFYEIFESPSSDDILEPKQLSLRNIYFPLIDRH